MYEIILKFTKKTNLKPQYMFCKASILRGGKDTKKFFTINLRNQLDKLTQKQNT